MYSYGELGYKNEGSFHELRDTIDAAISHSVDMGAHPIGVWDNNERLLLVVIEGDVFELQIK